MKFDKEKFLEVLTQCFGNVQSACANYGCNRCTYYEHYNSDPDFKKKCEEAKEVRKDFIESALDKKIREGDTAAIIFAAKTICKDRGYVERMENEVHAIPPMTFNIMEDDGR